MAKKKLAHIKKSHGFICPDGKVRSYPSRGDLIDLLVRENLIETEDTLRSNPFPYERFFRAWVGSGQLGCQFAVKIAHEVPGTSDLWATRIIPEQTFGPARLRRLVDTYIRSTNKEAIAILFPGLTDELGIVHLINTLIEDSNWAWEEIENTVDDTLLVGLRWQVPDTQSKSWALGFASYGQMPLTRRSPVTAIMLKVTPSKRCPGGDDIDPAHLADLPPYFNDESVEPQTWEKTRQYKQKILNDKEQKKTKAKMTFALSPDARDLIDYAPQSFNWHSMDGKAAHE